MTESGRLFLWIGCPGFHLFTPKHPVDEDTGAQRPLASATAMVKRYRCRQATRTVLGLKLIPVKSTHPNIHIHTHAYLHSLIYTEFTQLAALRSHARGRRLGNALNCRDGNTFPPRFGGSEALRIKEQHSLPHPVYPAPSEISGRLSALCCYLEHTEPLSALPQHGLMRGGGWGGLCTEHNFASTMRVSLVPP